jgi:hypothetical protein
MVIQKILWCSNCKDKDAKIGLEKDICDKCPDELKSIGWIENNE